ncbi:hypothetical protein J990_1737 [Acinetobacter baumannii 45075_4]|nr:hypothetical protein J990_1737 [Acinetobacter baumannii 45075_4]
MKLTSFSLSDLNTITTLNIESVKQNESFLKQLIKSQIIS